MCKEEVDSRIDPSGLEEQDDEEEDEAKVIKKKKGWSRFYITIEPIRLLIGFTMALTDGVIIDILQRNVCYHNYNMTYTECTSHNISSEIKADIEALTAQVNMNNNIIQAIFPLCLALFIGPWSDVNGRKPFIIWPLRGFLVYYCLWVVFSFFPSIPALWLFIPSIPLGLSGSMVAIDVCSWSYTCDNFESEERTMRFSISVAAMLTGGLIGNFLAEELLLLGGEYGFQIIFIISFIVALAALLYATFYLEETVILKEKKGKLLAYKHILSIIDAVILKPTKGRLTVAFVLMVIGTEIPTYSGDNAISYLIGKSNYNWSLGRYNLFTAVGSLASAIGPVIGVWLVMDLAGRSNTTALIVSAIVLLILQFLRSISINETMYWITTLTAKCTNLVGSCIDTELVDVVSENNVGKAITFISLLDAVSPLISVPLFTQVYKSLLPDKTISVFFLTFGAHIVMLLGIIGLLIKKRHPYVLSPTEPPNNENVSPAEIETQHELTQKT